MQTPTSRSTSRRRWARFLGTGATALVAAARTRCQRVVASIFVNPKQFGPREDFSSYPRPEADDLAKLAAAKADLAFIPTVEEMYPAGFATTISLRPPAQDLEGAHRQGHFDGVATVVAKLLVQAAPDQAFFGEKDYKQLLVVRRMVRDLDLTAGMNHAHRNSGLVRRKARQISFGANDSE